MATNHRIKVKLGDAEFEAEGAEDKVQAQYEQFLTAIAHAPKPSVDTPLTKDKKNDQPPGPVDDALMMRLFEQREDGIVALRVLPQGTEREADTLLLLLYGYKRLRSEQNILATRLVRAANHSGLKLTYLNRVQAQLTQYVMRGGQRKGATYALNNQGVLKAEEIAAKMA